MSLAMHRGPKAAEETLYADVARRIESLIEDGTFGSGDKVPSVRRLAIQFRVSVTTAVQAYRLLENRGVIEARPQSGYYVRPRLTRAAAPAPTVRRMPLEPAGATRVENLLMRVMGDDSNPNLVPLGKAVPNPSLLPTEKLNRAMGTMMRRHRVLSNSYDTQPGCELLRVQVAKRALSSGCVLSPRDIITTCGAQEAIGLALRAVCKPGDIVAIDSPTFYGHLQMIEALGYRALEIPLDPREGPRLDDLAAAIKAHKVSVFLCITNFQNPLGCTMGMDAKREMVELLERRGVPLIEDDIYGDLPHGDQRPGVAKSFDATGNVILCSSYSKTLAPGYRVGWVAPGKWYREISRLKTLTNIATPMPTQLAVADFLENGGYDHHLRKIRRIYAHQCAAMAAAVAEHFPAGTRVSSPTGGYVLWVELPTGTDTLDLYERAIAAGIGFAPGALFAPGNRYRNCLRLNAAFWDDRVRAAIVTLGRMAGRS